MRQEISKGTIEYVCYWHPQLGMQPTLQVVCFISETPFEKTKFSVTSRYYLEIASGLGMGPPLRSALGPHLVYTCTNSVHSVSVSVGSNEL